MSPDFGGFRSIENGGSPKFLKFLMVSLLMYMGSAGILINALLMVLNLLPLPPLDGGRVLTGVLPGPYAYQFARIEPYGFWILIILLMTGVLGVVLWPFVSAFLHMMAAVAGMKPGYLETVLFALMN